MLFSLKARGPGKPTDRSESRRDPHTEGSAGGLPEGRRLCGSLLPAASPPGLAPSSGLGCGPRSRLGGGVPRFRALTPASPAGDTGSDAPLTGRSSPRDAPPAAEKPPRVRAPSPAPPSPANAPPTAPPDPDTGAGPAPGAGPERRGLLGAHARSAAARRVHSRRSFQRPRARRRPALLKLSSLQPSCYAPPHALEQEETPL